jgi:hypothetical protein
MIKVAKMDRESFEIYAMDKGFEFFEFKEDDDTKGLIMVKGEYGSEEFLTNYSIFFWLKYAVVYQTANTNRLSSIYKELKTLGFKLVDSEALKNGSQYKKNYERGTKEELDIYIESDWVEISYVVK